MKNRTHSIVMEKIEPFDIMVRYLEVDLLSPENTHDLHMHDECEIYINLSGDVSFAVENSIYPVMPGNIVITRPYEYHHCIYHSNKLHKHFWILFSPSGNEGLLEVFFKRDAGKGNLLSLTPEKTEELVTLCHRMSEHNDDAVANYYNFFRLISLLQSADVADSDGKRYPHDVVFAIDYIDKHFASDITVKDIARGAHVSLNTLERHFLKFFGVSPTNYIRKKRLANSARLLAEGCSVTEASERSGFSDYSNFIALFRKTYGITPLKYKKNIK